MCDEVIVSGCNLDPACLIQVKPVKRFHVRPDSFLYIHRVKFWISNDARLRNVHQTLKPGHILVNASMHRAFKSPLTSTLVDIINIFVHLFQCSMLHALLHSKRCRLKDSHSNIINSTYSNLPG